MKIDLLRYKTLSQNTRIIIWISFTISIWLILLIDNNLGNHQIIFMLNYMAIQNLAVMAMIDKIKQKNAINNLAKKLN